MSHSSAEICFEDFAPGETITYGDTVIERDEIVAFAAAFDPQPFHLDEASARGTFAGSLIASGWQSCAIINRMNCDFFLNRSSCMGSPGIDEMKWLRPVRPGDRLRVRRSILGAQTSQSKPDRGTVQFLYELINQNDDIAARHDCRVIFGRRSPASGTQPPAALRPAKSSLADPPALQLETLPFFDELPLNVQTELGSFTFTDDNIRAFARAYDNQAFHLDPDAASHSIYGGIIASGWQTASAWMGCMVRSRSKRMDAIHASGGTPATLGVSPGFTNLRWLKPVRPGDTLTFRTRVIAKRASASRPGWGLVSSLNTGDNQHGERVFQFNGLAFWERRQP